MNIMHSEIKYFAYGSNLSHNQMNERCPGAIPICPARVIGYRLVFAGNSQRWRGAVADIRPNTEWYVQGGLYRMRKRDLKSLDFYEGYPDFYTREECEIILPTGEAIIGLIYRMTNNLKIGKPSKSYLETIIRGFFDFGIAPPPEISASEYVE